MDELAFPTGNPVDGGHSGMTQRQWYTGKLIPSIFANSKYNDYSLDQKIALAFRVSDKMIKFEEDGE